MIEVLPQMAGLLLVSACFSATETAIFSLEPLQIERRCRGDSVRARSLRWCLDHPRSILLAILLSNLAVNTFYFAIAGAWMGELPAVQAAGVSLASVLFLLCFAEILPKSVAMGLAEPIASSVAPFLRVWTKLLTPVHLPASYVMRYLAWRFRPDTPNVPELSADEMHELVNAHPERFGLPSRTALLIGEVVQLAGAQVRELMDPLPDLHTVSKGEPAGALRKRLLRERQDWCPVTDEGDVCGFVDLRALLAVKDETPIEQCLEDLPAIPETARAPHLFEFFHREGVGRALVVDEYGASVGVVGWGDLVESVVGHIAKPESEVEDSVEQIGDRVWRVDGTLGIREFGALFAIDLRAQRNRTIGGWLIEKLGRVPVKGEGARLPGFVLEAGLVHKGRVRQVVVRFPNADAKGQGGRKR